MSLGDPARDDAVVVGELLLDSDGEVAVAEQQLVQRQRLGDPLMALVVAGVDVVDEVSAVDALRRRRVGARANPLEREPGELLAAPACRRL